MNGFIVIDKPSGITSHDVIARCRRVLGVKRIGHAGTLDPAATGVLLVGIGRATRLLRFLEASDKEYEAEVILGVTTSTQDASGDVLDERDATAVSRAAVNAALERFRGPIEQVPPMVSAVKVGGERLYKKARRGETVERAPRAVTIHELELLMFEPPVLRLRVACSKGTYIRALASDIGDVLECGAHLRRLRRTRSGSFTLAHAVPLDDVAPGSVRDMGEAVEGYPRRTAGDEEVRALVHGQRLTAAGIDGPYAVWGPGGLVAMAEDVGDEARSICVVIGS